VRRRPGCDWLALADSDSPKCGHEGHTCICSRGASERELLFQVTAARNVSFRPLRALSFGLKVTALCTALGMRRANLSAERPRIFLRRVNAPLAEDQVLVAKDDNALLAVNKVKLVFGELA